MNLYKMDNGDLVQGMHIFVFRKNVDYHLVSMEIYANGTIHCWDTFHFSELEHRLSIGQICLHIPNNSIINIFPLGSIKLEAGSFIKKNAEFVKEVADIIESLNGRPTSQDWCKKAYSDYIENPSEENKQLLSKMYNEVPEYNRIFILGDIDVKDHPIKEILEIG